MGVLIWSSVLMFSEVIRHLLQAKGVSFVTVIQPEDENGFIERLSHDRPDVVIFDEATFGEKPACILGALFEAEPDVCIAVFNVQDNRLSVYKKVQLIVKQLDDFYDSIFRE